MNKDLTIIIPSYRSKNLILKHIKKISNKFRIIIVENSYDRSLEKIIKKEYKSVSIYLKKNIGFGRAVNFASKKVLTKYFFVMNPDAIIYKNTIKNLIVAAKKIKNFGAISPAYLINNRNYKKKNIYESTNVISAAMLVKKKTFLKIKGFDENFFLYYEDDDFFLRCKFHNLKLFIVNKSLISHNKSKIFKETLNLHSTTFSNLKERSSTMAVGGWHGQWSKFYFIKKHYGFIKAFANCLPDNFINLLQFLVYIIYKPSRAKYKYFKIEGFICSLIGTKSFKRSIFDKNYFKNFN
ncbi:glycosyltransferase [Candidatus Pelagibacter sp. HIMB1485]|uniref:glycosyltransferase n=1 Tax=Candidatus Pelagibacter sp. HIMB1485 TaxID=3415415 RepID=UPI003F82711A